MVYLSSHFFFQVSIYEWIDVPETSSFCWPWVAEMKYELFFLKKECSVDPMLRNYN